MSNVVKRGSRGRWVDYSHGKKQLGMFEVTFFFSGLEVCPKKENPLDSWKPIIFLLECQYTTLVLFVFLNAALCLTYSQKFSSPKFAGFLEGEGSKGGGSPFRDFDFSTNCHEWGVFWNFP